MVVQAQGPKAQGIFPIVHKNKQEACNPSAGNDTPLEHISQSGIQVSKKQGGWLLRYNIPS